MAGRFENSKLQQWQDQADSPAAPAGMQQGATAAAGFESGDSRFENSKLGQWVSDKGYVETAQTWYSGANQEGTNNGWNSDFFARTMEQNQRLAEEGKLAQQFEQDDATGVVTWDHQSSDGTRAFQFGDIYDGGRKVGNVFEQFDADTANLMMADVLFDGKTKAEIFADNDRMPRLAREVAGAREERNTAAEQTKEATAFNEGVQERAEGFREGAVDEAIVAGGAAGGAALGAGIGSAFFGVGALPGALLGGAIGGVGAFLNQDALTEQAARAYEITSMSNRENSTGAAIATGVKEWAGFSGRLISPVGNLAQGTTDWLQGDIGDGVAERYAVNDQGESTAPLWSKVADVGALVTDSLLQFATPLGAAAFTTQMTGMIGGEVSELALTGGNTFDYARGGFDNVFTDDDGNFDLSSAAAGIGKVGIDVAQLGMARGLLGKAAASRAAVGAAPVGKTPLTQRLFGERARKGEDLGQAAGFRFTRNADGSVSRKATLSLLAPSEQLAALSARVIARRQGALAGGAYSTDDFYRAATALSLGERKVQTVLVNAMGEGYEEGVQAAFEAHSHGHDLDLGEIGQSALMGFAAGAGMGLATSMRSPSADERMFAQAQLGAMLRGRPEMTRTEWAALPEVEKRSRASLADLERTTLESAYGKFVDDQAADINAGVVGANKLADAVQSKIDQDAAVLTDRTDGAFVITQLENAGAVDADGALLPGSMPSNAVASSAKQMAENLRNHGRGVLIQRNYLEGRLAELTEQLAADPTNEELLADQGRVSRTLDQTKLTLNWTRWLDQHVDVFLDRIHADTATTATVAADVEALNQFLRSAFNRGIDRHAGGALTPDDKMALARAVSMVYVRDPQDQSGSYQVLVPQVSAALTMAGAHNNLQISHAILPAIRGDFDGDKIRQQAQLIFDEEAFTAARSGAFFLGAGSSVNVTAPKYEKWVVEYLAKAHRSGNPALVNYADGTLLQIGGAIRARYAGVIEAEVLDPILRRFYDAVRGNDGDARSVLLDGLAQEAGGAITEFGRKNLSNEWLWIDQLIRASFQDFQETYAAYRPVLVPNTEEGVPVKRGTAVKERRQLRAATTGSTVGLLLAGDSPFRQAQKLHYSSLVASVLSTENAGSRDQVYALAQLYEALGQGLTTNELAAPRAKDDITARVYARLERIALEASRMNPDLNRVEALSVIANLRISDIDIDADGTVSTTGNEISLAQFLLKQSLAEDLRKNDAIFDTTPELQAKHARLGGMVRADGQGRKGSKINASRAFVEVVGSQQLVRLLGDEADIFGPHLTVEQYLRYYISLSEHDRRSLDRKLEQEAAYIGRTEKHNAPYDLTEVAAGEVSAYRAVVDAITAVGHNSISINYDTAVSKDLSKRHLNGEKADRSYTVSDNFRDAHARIREALYSFLELSPREHELTPEMVQRLLESNPDFARRLMDTIPNDVANVVFQQRGDSVFIANWVYGTFALRDAKHAEMHYWRNLLMAEWNAAGVDPKAESADGQKARDFHSLKRRMHRVMFNLALPGNELRLEQFFETMMGATDLEAFLRWVNTAPGVRGEQAPLTAWVDDVAEFDMDKAQGGWSTSLAGSDLRLAIGSLKTAAENLVADLAEERRALDTDRSTISQLRRGAKADASSEDRELYLQFTESIRQAGQLALGLGPQAMIYQSLGAALGFYPQAHTKGKNPPHVVAAGAFDALRDAFDYTTNYERVMAALTAVNLDAVGSNLGQVAKGAGRTMDDQGRVVEWPEPTPEQMLALLERADTRPLARAILFPQVMERGQDGTIRPQLLIGKTLKEFISGTTHNDLFPKAGVLHRDSALRYVSLVEATAREFGGLFSVQRAANDRLIARTSAADHVLSATEIERMAYDVYYELAQELQAAGSIAAAAAPGTDPLTEIREKLKGAQKAVALGRDLSLGGDGTEAFDNVIRSFREEAEAERVALLEQSAGMTDAVEAARFERELELVDARLERNLERLELLRADDQVAQARLLFAIPEDAAEAEATKVQITEYVRNNMHLLERSSSSLLVLSKLTAQLEDSGRVGRLPELEEKEWTALSNAIIGVYLDDATASGTGSVAPFPDADHTDDWRYYDRTFSYLADPILDIESPLVKAAAKVHKLAGRFGEETRDTELVELLNRTVFAEWSLGRWTSDIPRASISANERLDSASAEPAIAMPGNSPKRQAVISAATRRTFRVPGDEHMSTAELSWMDLHREIFDDVDIVLPSGPARRPLAQLNNRFARSVTMTYTDTTGAAQTVDLLAADRELGRVWGGDAAALSSGLVEIHVDRIRATADKVATRAKVNPAQVKVQIEFVHPDSQPIDSVEDQAAGRTWMNNLFFEGTSFKLDADRHKSLNSTLWFTEGSINPVAQATALDASKLGMPALQVVPTASAEDRRLIEDGWDQDFAAMLRAKARVVLKSELGFGKLDPEFYNAVYKDLKLRHLVTGVQPGTNIPMVWTAEQVIAHQQANPGVPLPIENYRLWTPTDDVLRTLLGEQGRQGVPGPIADRLEIDLTKVPLYKGITEQMLTRFAAGVAGETTALERTRLMGRARQHLLQVRTQLDDATRSAYDARMRYQEAERQEIHAARAAWSGKTGSGGFNPTANLAKAVTRGDRLLRAESISFDWSGMGLPFGPRKMADSAVSRMMLADLESSLASDGYRTGWIYREGDKEAVPVKGVLSQVSLTGGRDRALQVAPGDLVVVELDSFKDDLELARERLHWLVDRGATVVLGSGDGRSYGRPEAAEYLESLNYERVTGSVHVYQPIKPNSRFQTVQARLSSLTETRGISPQSHVAVLNVADKAIEENAAWVNYDNPRLKAIAVSMNLVPADFLAGFNVPVQTLDLSNQVDEVVAHLRGMDTVEGRAHLRQMANHKLEGDARAKADVEFDEAFAALLRRFDDNEGSVLPGLDEEFGTGDLIPLVDGFGRVLLYRHGMKAPSRDQVDAMTALTLPGSMNAHNVAVYPTDPEPAATTHRGRVIRFRPRSAHGLEVELELDLQMLGDKAVLEWNGMKYLLTQRPDSIPLPTHGFLANWGIDLIASAHDMMSKESFDGLVNSHRNAFAYFGIDFTQDAAKFFGTDARGALEILNAVATSVEPISVEAAHELLSAPGLPAGFAEKLPEQVQVDRLRTDDSVEAQIVRALIVYLATPGAQVEHVLRSGGFNDTTVNPDAKSILMPRLFTQVFDRAPLGSELRVEINRRLNTQLHNPKKDSTGYVLRQDFVLEVLNDDPRHNLQGFLQFSEAHSSGDNPIKNGMAFDENEKGAVSAHSAAIAYQATGAVTAYAHDLGRARAFAEGKGVTRFDRDSIDGGAWRMLTGVNAKTAPRWRSQFPAEAARRTMARETLTQFRQPIETLDEFGWNDTQRAEYLQLALSIVRTLGLKDGQLELVDFWTRQMMGDAAGTDRDGNKVGRLSGKAAVAAAKDIEWAVQRGYLPTVGAEVPLLHAQDLQAIYRANRNGGGWKPRESMAPDDASKAQKWDDWVKVSLGSALTSESLFDPLYLLALDGLMYTYQDATRDLLDLPVSMDVLVSEDLMDEKTNRMLASLDPNQDFLTAAPVTLDVERASLQDLLGGRRIANGKLEAKVAPASEIAKRRARIREWRKENDVPLPVDVTMKNFRKNGAEFVHTSTTTSALARMLINLRVGTALLNPALYVSMGPEQWVRGTIDRVSNLLTGQATAGATSSLAAKTGLSKYSPDQLKKLRQLYETLGQRKDFKSMVYQDLMYLQPHEPGMGRVERVLAGYAKVGARMQDPTWGMRADTLARRYLEAAIQHIDATPTLNILSTDQLIAELSVNPQYLKQHYPDAHKAASNAIAQLRSLKTTPLSLALRGIYEPLSESSNGAVNFFGNVVLKMPLLFSGYGMNVLTTITGMQGLSDMSAMFLHGRTNGFKHPRTLLGRVQAKLAGREITPDDDANFDMSSIIEGLDLTRSFIRGGVTHTGLFAFGLMAGGLGLSGEDDETKKRRKLAEAQGAGFIYDPRRIENDFRNADALFLDWLPFGREWFKVTGEGEVGGARHMGQLHWMLKQFVSPIMGIERFFETGDFRQVTWGFQDAIGSFPLINTLMWDDAVQTAHEFARMADEEQTLGGPSNLIASAGFLTNAVGVYERMLFENAFVNQLYTSFDRYDRDPYALPLRDSDGDLQRDIEGNTRANDLAMEQYIDPETGEVREGYKGRDTLGATMHALTENRATMAFAMSLFTGLGDSDYLRRNMPKKQRDMEKQTISQGEAEAVVRALSQQAGGQQLLTNDELAQIWKNQAAAAGTFVNWAEVDAAAVAAEAKGQFGTAQAAPMSVLDAQGREILTADGARGVFQGLAKGAVKIGDASLAGVYIPFEMRQAIQKEWMAELIQEGVDMGLDQTKATTRMKRLWYGPTDDPAVQGLGDLLWHKDISYSDKITYNQLNTTYVVGPDGRPWATGFTRDGLMGALGLKPVKRAYVSEQSSTGTDGRLNTTDLINNRNTGLRALELHDESADVPTDVEIGKAIEDAIKEAAQQDFQPFAKTTSSGGGRGGYGGGRRRGGYGGYSGGGGGGYFTRMYALPGGNTPYGNSIPFINTSNPLIRRADVRRERVWSERGRLNQWQ